MNIGCIWFRVVFSSNFASYTKMQYCAFAISIRQQQLILFTLILIHCCRRLRRRRHRLHLNRLWAIIIYDYFVLYSFYSQTPIHFAYHLHILIFMFISFQFVSLSVALLLSSIIIFHSVCLFAIITIPTHRMHFGLRLVFIPWTAWRKEEEEEKTYKRTTCESACNVNK